MSAHTLGPWKVVERGASFSSHEIRPVQPFPGSIPLAWVAKLNDGEANAKLIAAAPDLLAALKGMLDAYGELHARFDLGECQQTLDARAAIAKAEGQS